MVDHSARCWPLAPHHFPARGAGGGASRPSHARLTTTARFSLALSVKYVKEAITWEDEPVAAKEKVEALGAKAATGVSKKVTDVIAGSDAGSKLAKAEKLGLRIHSEEEFQQLLEQL